MRPTLALTLIVGASASTAIVSATGATKSALLELDPQSFEEQVVQRGTGKAPFIITFTMGPDSPCGPCHQLRPIVRDAAEAMRPHVRVGVLLCDVPRLKRVCEAHMEGRGYYPIVKVYGAPGVEKILDLEHQRPELPSGTIMKLLAAIVEVLSTVRKAPKRFWAEPGQ